ncbi:MAG TPA: DinB family protein [Thermoanaerobaculia bacterium]|nr:DinB family protein [Thermoanaerobaculia bacterium]
MNEHDALTDVERELEEATTRARTLTEKTDARHFTVRPHPASWSAAECLAHLSISTEMFLPVLRDAIDRARRSELRGKGQPTMDILGRVLRWFLEPPIRQRVKTSQPFVPKSTRARADAFAEFRSLQEKLLAMIEEARGLDLKKMKVVSPFDKRVRYNVFSAFRIIAAHQRRHLWQAEQAIEEVRRQSLALGAA